MDRKLKRWEMALMLGLLCALVGGSWLGQEQHELADSVIRFHVIANSDSAQHKRSTPPTRPWKVPGPRWRAV